MDNDEIYGIDKSNGHPRAIEIIPDDFFWDCVDELAPFGSDEGDTALSEYRDWRNKNPDKRLEECMIWTIESVGGINVSEYSDEIYYESTVRKQIEDPDFNDEQYIFTTDISVIATAFGQLVDEGKIDQSAKLYVERALKRQIIWVRLQDDWEYADTYIRNLSRMRSALEAA
jgi:uncharacterized protein YfeS